MKKILYHLSSILIITLFLVACKKDNDNNPGPDPNPGETLLVKKISSTPDNFEEYQYNNLSQLTKYSSQWQNGNGGFNRLNNLLEYENGRLVRMTNEAGTITYTYTGNKITAAEVVSFSNKKIAALTFSYNAKNQLEYVLEKPYEVQAGQAIETKTTYTYYPDGNLKQTDFLYRTIFSNNFIVDFTKKYTSYDSKKNPTPSFVIGFYLPGVELFKNNPLRVENYNANGEANGYSRYEYTYNQQAYPATKKHYIAVPNKPEEFPASYTYTY